MQIILWHDVAGGGNMRWSHSMDDGRGTVDIAGQMRDALSHDDEDHGHD
jgi:hypothetical protein